MHDVIEERQRQKNDTRFSHCDFCTSIKLHKYNYRTFAATILTVSVILLEYYTSRPTSSFAKDYRHTVLP